MYSYIAIVVVIIAVALTVYNYFVIFHLQKQQKRETILFKIENFA